MGNRGRWGKQLKIRIKRYECKVERKRKEGIKGEKVRNGILIQVIISSICWTQAQASFDLYEFVDFSSQICYKKDLLSKRFCSVGNGEGKSDK